MLPNGNSSLPYQHTIPIYSFMWQTFVWTINHAEHQMLGKTLSSNLESHRKIPQAVTLEEAQALNLPENLHELPNNLL